MPTIASRLSDNLERIRQRMRAACERAGRDVSSVRLVAVTKYARLEWVRELVGQGVTTLGESRPQQLVQRAGELPPSVEWHLVGHLQRNKVRLVLPHVALIHSVDSPRLLARINAEAEAGSGAGGGAAGSAPGVLLEVNVSGEASKDGFDPAALVEAWPQLAGSGPVAICGLMTMAPAPAPAADDDPEAARPVFRELRRLRDRLVAISPAAGPLPQLSMGMSGDFEVAIEEGATLVRIGGALFEGLV